MKDKDYRVGIVGYGVVGRGIHRLLKDDVKCVYDPLVEAVEPYSHFLIGRDKECFADVELIVVCVMTAMKGDGSCNTKIVEESLDWIHEINPEAVVLIKSAVVPSEIKRLKEKYIKYGGSLGVAGVILNDFIRLVVSPEYMGESKYFTPFWKYPDPMNMESHPWQVFGGQKEDTSLCVDVFKRRMSVDCIQIQTDLMTAALCKYMENAFFATKVTFCNEWFDIAKAMGVDYNELRECWLADTRINKNHTLVFPKDRGYGGKCFPKDVKAIIADARKFGAKAELMEAVDKVNERIRDGD
jgi:UDPglucose 6-dehydrogenase